MAGNKVNTKAKGKDDKNKSNKLGNQTNEEAEEIDFALLRKPILTSITGFAQARKIFDSATEELKGILSHECDILYECKVCRNIFRSLANFISHKRLYCKENFNSSVHGHFIKSASIANEILKIRHLEQSLQKSADGRQNTQYQIEEDNDRVPLTKDLTTIVEKLIKTKGVYSKDADTPAVNLQTIPNSDVAVFQNVNFGEKSQPDNMRCQVNEINKMLSKDQAILQSDGKFKISSNEVNPETDNVIQISDDDENDDSNTNILKCSICDLQFSTRKTLKFHMKYKHLESRLVYPCPDCVEIFSTSWSVYRHLFKVHRKTAAQIRRLRESIQAKAFRMNNPPAFYEKRKNLKPAATQKFTEEEKRDQENQAWMVNMEGDGEVPRCGGCGRTFERRAALAAHTHTCQPRSRALARRPAHPSQTEKKIEIQIRKDYNKGTTNVNFNTSNADENKILTDTPRNISNTNNETTAVINDKDKELEEAVMDVDIENVNTDSSTKPLVSNSEEYKPPFRLPFSQQSEKNNFIAFTQRLSQDIEIGDQYCNKCESKFDNIQEFYDHMAEHYKWVRYACKLCNYKHYIFEKLPEHVKTVHKLKGDSDFYFSTVKAVDGNEASELAVSKDDNEGNETSPNSRRPSRCSSDSSRLSDDSSSSSTRIETGSKKRKIIQNKNGTKKFKRDDNSLTRDDCEDPKENEITMDKTHEIIGTNIKAFDENSSDIDDSDDKIPKRQLLDEVICMASRRPVRKKTRPKNEDFEYDLSNLLKMEAQGYRDSQSITSTKSNQNKKKVLHDPYVSNIDTLNKDCCGALLNMAKKSLEKSAAHVKMINFGNYSHRERTLNPFVRPMLPRSNSKMDKSSPKKDSSEELKTLSTTNKLTKTLKISNEPIPNNNIIQCNANTNQDNKKDEELGSHEVEKLTTVIGHHEENKSVHRHDSSVANSDKNSSACDDLDSNVKSNLDVQDNKNSACDDPGDKDKPNLKTSIENDINNFVYDDSSELVKSNLNKTTEQVHDKNMSVCVDPADKVISKLIVPTVQDKNNSACASPADKDKSNLNKPTVVPLKFSRESLEVMKNPIINKNLTDFTKAGMKTKILVIKPIHRNKDGQKINAPLKFQTIKLKDPSKSSSTEDSILVKVPKVDCSISRTITDSSVAKSDSKSVDTKSCNAESAQINAADKSEIDDKEGKINEMKDKITTPSENLKKTDVSPDKLEVETPK